MCTGGAPVASRADVYRRRGIMNYGSRGVSIAIQWIRYGGWTMNPIGVRLFPLALCLSAPAAAIAAEGAPPAAMPASVPEPAAQAEAEKLVREVFKAEYARRAPADRLALARRLLRQGQEAGDDAAARFVLFREAAALAAEAGEPGVVLEAVEATARHFMVDSLALKAERLGGMDPARLKAEAQPRLAAALLGALEEAVGTDRAELGARIAKAAEAVAQRGQDSKLQAHIQARLKAVRELETAQTGLKAALAVLAEKPGDPGASLTVGRFYCLLKGDWERGLPMLAKGEDAGLRALAERDLGQPEGAAARLALANGWWEAAEKGAGAAKARLQERATYWYEQALPGLTGLSKVAAEKRLEAARSAGGGGAPASGLLRERQPAVIHANCDNKFVLCVNGKEVLKGDNVSVPTPVRLEISLRAGDILTTRCENTEGPAGFSCAIVFPELKQAIPTNMRGWKCYSPRTPAQWAAPAGVDKVRTSGVGTNQEWGVAVNQASGFNCVALWGEESALVVYLTLKISDEYLVPPEAPASNAAAPAWTSPGAQWALIQALGDDAFLLAINGEVVLYGEGNAVWTLAMPLRMGDCITVRGVNTNGMAGFGCAVTFPARKKAAVTDLKHWRCYVPRDAKTWYAVEGVSGEKPPSAEAQHVWKSALKAKTGLDCEMVWGPDPLATAYLCFRLSEDAFVSTARVTKPDVKGHPGGGSRTR
jgi:hypothetical protein